MKVTLVSEGTSDQALLPIIDWTLRKAGLTSDLELRWADLRGLPSRPASLSEKIRFAYELFPCEILIVHRDADNSDYATRANEIAESMGPLILTNKHVCLIPVRMSEAWLLFDERAIRLAAGNPHSNCKLDLPKLNQIERLADPKQTLFQQLKMASELSGRRLRKFDRNRARAQVAEYIDDFESLRQLAAFQAFEQDVKAALV